MRSPLPDRSIALLPQLRRTDQYENLQLYKINLFVIEADAGPVELTQAQRDAMEQQRIEQAKREREALLRGPTAITTEVKIVVVRCQESLRGLLGP